MSDNTKRYHYIILIQVGLDGLFANDPNVFVAGDLLWYPVKGKPSIRAAPDVMVVFGRPKGHRASYRQWAEGGIAPQVVFEILSPGNTPAEMREKRAFYEYFGVREYVEYDSDGGALETWERVGDRFERADINGVWRSPLLGVMLKLEAGGELSVYRPDGRKFLPPAELDAKMHEAEAEAARAREQAKQERKRAKQERERAEQERERAEQERERAVRAEQARERLAAKLRELGIDPDALTE
jgi:Uma2 family endonuclease